MCAEKAYLTLSCGETKVVSSADKDYRILVDSDSVCWKAWIEVTPHWLAGN